MGHQARLFIGPFLFMVSWIQILQFALEFLERSCGLAPVIRKAASLRKVADRLTKGKGTERREAARTGLWRLTKSLDTEGIYRTQPRTAIEWLNTCWRVSLVLFVIIDLPLNWWFYRGHYWGYNTKTADYLPLRYWAACICGWYSWDVLAKRYGRLDFALTAHHVMTIAASALIMIGIYLPFASWFSVWMVGLQFPTNMMAGFRGRHAHTSPETTKKMLVACFYWYVVCCTFNVCGNLAIVIRGYVIGYWKWYHAFMFVLMFGAWLYQDSLTFRGLRELSKMDTKDLDVTRPLTERGHTQRSQIARHAADDGKLAEPSGAVLVNDGSILPHAHSHVARVDSGSDSPNRDHNLHDPLPMDFASQFSISRVLGFTDIRASIHLVHREGGFPFPQGAAARQHSRDGSHPGHTARALSALKPVSEVDLAPTASATVEIEGSTEAASATPNGVPDTSPDSGTGYTPVAHNSTMLHLSESVGPPNEHATVRIRQITTADSMTVPDDA